MPSELEYQDLVLVEYRHKGYITKLIELLNDKLIIAINQSNIETTINLIFLQCETCKFKGLITLLFGQIQEVIGYYITSLFTPLQYRHKGYATKLMELLNDKLIVAINQSNIETTINSIFLQCETCKLKGLIILLFRQIQKVIGYYITSLFTPS
ncbi:31320_t:CDS:2 [Gigaspora margarita]|uniref:31320_t:CDS:1 n=1 Tax=Gigaspora margarita TaxID=4874 RepID=A0ABN7UD83_GIGMA|nr:31320_t:CDS:2 [Gigaspora margarita]